MHTCKCTDPILSSVVLNESHSFIVTNMVPDMEMTKRMLQVMSEKEEKAYHADYLDYRDSLIIIANGNCCLAAEEKKELLAYLQLELKKDPNQGNVIGMTKLQLVEITRKKIRKTLEESLHG